MSQNVLVTGTGREQALGFAFVRRYLEQGDVVFASVRKPSEALENLQKSYPNNLHILQMDIGNTESVVNAAKEAHLHDFIMQLPNGYDTILHDNGSDLSAGQRQLLTIARAFLCDPKILILDDSTSALDYLSDLHVRENISAISGLTKIIVSQRAGSLKDCDMICVFDKGEIVGSGTHEELLENCTIYREIYDMQRSQ